MCINWSTLASVHRTFSIPRKLQRANTQKGTNPFRTPFISAVHFHCFSSIRIMGRKKITQNMFIFDMEMRIFGSLNGAYKPYIPTVCLLLEYFATCPEKTIKMHLKHTFLSISFLLAMVFKKACDGTPVIVTQLGLSDETIVPGFHPVKTEVRVRAVNHLIA